MCFICDNKMEIYVRFQITLIRRDRVANNSSHVSTDVFRSQYVSEKWRDTNRRLNHILAPVGRKKKKKKRKTEPLLWKSRHIWTTSRPFRQLLPQCLRSGIPFHCHPTDPADTATRNILSYFYPISATIHTNIYANTIYSIWLLNVCVLNSSRDFLEFRFNFKYIETA